MNVRLDVQLDARNLRRLRRLEGASRLMAAKSLTFTAEKAVPAWRAGHRVFHRRNAWIDKGVRLRPATTRTMAAQVGTVDRYMARHVKGLGEDKHGARLFIPIYSRISDVLTHTRQRRRMKGFERTQRKPFAIKLNGGGLLIARRKGKGRAPLEILGKVQAGANVPERLDALGIVAGVVNREFPPVYERLLLKWAEG